MTFHPMSVEVTCVTLPKDHCVQVPWQYINVCVYSDQFCKIPHTYWHTTYYIKDLRGNPKPRVSPDRTGPDWTETGPGSGNIFKNLFGSSRVGEFYFGSVRVGVFFTGAWDIFSQDFGDKLAFHSQTVEVEWLLSLISSLFDVITSLQGIFTCLL